jgi:hypothetical protein
MNTVVWTTLITAVAALGGVLFTAVFAYVTQARQAARASAAAVLVRQRDAYAGLLGTARYWKSAAQEIQQEFEGLPKDLKIDRSRILVQDLTQAVARVELVGTAAARSGAEAIYDKSIAIGLMYAHFESQRPPARGHRRPRVLSTSDRDRASGAIKNLEAEIQSFLELVRREQGNQPPARVVRRSAA